MTGMWELSDHEFKIFMVNILRTPIDKVGSIQEHMAM